MQNYVNCRLNPFNSGTVFKTESDVCRRQILTYKDGPRNERIKTFMIAVDP